MNEKEYQEFDRKYAKLKQEIKDTPEKTTPRVLWRIYLAITSYAPVIADLTRQLTRIADAMENVESNDNLRTSVEIHGIGGD